MYTISANYAYPQSESTITEGPRWTEFKIGCLQHDTVVQKKV